VAVALRVPLGAFPVEARPGGKRQYYPRLMLAPLIHSYADGVFSSLRIEHATYRDFAVRLVVANLHPDHDRIATFRSTNKAAFEAALRSALMSGVQGCGSRERQALSNSR
jgi:transposase